MIKIRVHLALIAVLTVSLSAGFRESVYALQVLYDEISPKFDKNGLILKEQKIVAALSKNPTIIQWEFVQKLAPNIQWGILGTIGFGTVPTTGDISIGAFGMWIEKGEIAFPVAEITISGNLGELLKDIQMVGNDLEFRDSISGPTVKFAEMTIGGKADET